MDQQRPLGKKYFNDEMMSKYQPLVDAVDAVEDLGSGDAAAMKSLEDHWTKFMDFSWCSEWNGMKYDIIFYGMSGYFGYLIMEFLKRNEFRRKHQEFTFAFAGRSSLKVAEMRDREFAGTQWANTPIIEARFDDVVSIVDLVKSAHVIVNIAGPYMVTEGEVLIDACIWCKTDYVDISQELPWSLRVKELHNYARDAGVIVVPSASGTAYADLGVFILAKKLREDYGDSLRNAVCYCSGGGQAVGPSGGMIRTRAALGAVDEELRKTVDDPFALGGFIPDVDRWGRKEVNIQYGTGFVTPKPREEDLDACMSKVSEDKRSGIWRAPYVHATFDARMVRRSNMLHADLGNQPYGLTFNFQEFAMLPREDVAAAKVAARRGVELDMGAIGQHGIPEDEERVRLEAAGKTHSDGEGPALEELSGAWTGFFLHAESAHGQEARCCFVGADGYFETARVAVELALTLRFDRQQLPYKGGVLTPSVAGGMPLIERLIASDVKFKIGSWFDSSQLAPPDIE